MPQKTHTMHGRDHCHNGADPIPCLPPAAPSGDFEGTVLATDNLIGYWRLGETGGPWADTSGYSPGSPADLTLEDGGGSGTLPTPDVTGAITNDDGAVEFNYDGTSLVGGQWLEVDAGDRFDLNAMTVCAWVKVKSSGLTRRGLIVGNSSSGASTQLGWGLQVTYPGREIRFTRGQPGGGAERYAVTTGGVTAAQWYFAVGTYDGDTIRLYIDSALAAETAYSSGAEEGDSQPLRVGVGFLPGTVPMWLYGTVDEAAVWNRPLTQTEINTLYQAGVSGAVGRTVLVSDGEGGTSWQQVPPDAIEPGTDGQVLQTVDGAVVWAADPAGDPAADTFAWMPLTTVTGGVPELVWDGSDDLIPTLVAM